MIERSPIRFEKWTPVERDYSIGYSYTHPFSGRSMMVGRDRWQRVKASMAASALSTGAETFRATGGLGGRRWARDVLVSQEEADAFFVAAIDAGAFLLAGMHRRALAARDRRLELAARR